MSGERRADLTGLLRRAGAGDEEAKDRLVSEIYEELRRIAGGLMRSERRGHTLQPSALVNEAILRLLGGDRLADFPNRRYLFAAAAEAMRRVLVDHARGRDAGKRGGGRVRVPLDEALVAIEGQGLDVIALHEALGRLAQAYSRPAEVVNLRFFVGLSVAEVAEALDVSDTTVESDWRFGRAWLKGHLGGAER
jgi:RNA polymerase sigma factor (TIGR02999 family)